MGTLGPRRARLRTRSSQSGDSERLTSATAGFNFYGAQRSRLLAETERKSLLPFSAGVPLALSAAQHLRREVERLGMRIRARRSSAMTPLGGGCSKSSFAV